MKKYLLIIIFLLSFLCLTGCQSSLESKRMIITTNFPCYDFVRAILKDDSPFEVKMLLSPGQEVHDFEPTPQDILEISKSELFFYVGGESDEWVSRLISNGELKQTKVLKMMDLVSTMNEESVEGMEMEEEAGVDEHVWTSLENAREILSKLLEEIIHLDQANEEIYRKNAFDYLSLIKDLEVSFQEVVKNSKRKELIFGDRFPFLYFVKEFGLSYYAAFPGCSSRTEANPKTIQFLIETVKQDSIPVVLHLELSNSKIAEAIAKETGAQVRELHSIHNVSSEDFENGVTYIDLMKKNMEVLKEALNA